MRDAQDAFSLQICSGPVMAMQRGRPTDLAPGDAYFMTWSEPGAFDRPKDGDWMTVRMERKAVLPFLRNAHDNIGRGIPRGTAGLSLLARYVSLLDENTLLATPEERALAARHVLDLVSLILGATADMREQAGRRGARAALVKTVTAHIDRNCSRMDVSLESVALQFGASPRSIQRAFADAGTTFTDVVRERRLSSAHRMLSDRRYEGLRVGDIALAAGFGDLSHFNRLFRKRFGRTPTDLRG
jgi:AraC-like DNA-binding protein